MAATVVWPIGDPRDIREASTILPARTLSNQSAWSACPAGHRTPVHTWGALWRSSTRAVRGAASSELIHSQISWITIRCALREVALQALLQAVCRPGQPHGGLAPGTCRCVARCGGATAPSAHRPGLDCVPRGPADPCCTRPWTGGMAAGKIPSSAHGAHGGRAVEPGWRHVFEFGS